MQVKFNSDTKQRKLLFSALHFAHPAKMHYSLLLWIVGNFTKEGSIVVDPMAGCGTTMLGCRLGRNVILNELESKFVKMCEDNWAKVQTFGAEMGYTMGWCKIMQGDARQLNSVLADTIISSPPYAEAQSGGGIAQKGYRGPKHNPTDLVGKRSYMPEQAGQSEGQISQLPYGSIDAVISSPPYEEILSKGHRSKLGNIKRQGSSYADCVITSPPYEGSVSAEHCGIDWAKGTDGGKPRDKSKEPAFNHTAGWGLPWTYSEDKENIGNLKGQTYLAAMLEVYQACYRVLKPQGLMILVTKNFIRNKQIVRLDEDTIKICGQAGFEFQERHYRKLTNQSFWRTIYQQKYPDAPVLDTEDVLVFKRMSQGVPNLENPIE